MRFGGVKDDGVMLMVEDLTPLSHKPADVQRMPYFVLTVNPVWYSAVVRL